MEQDIILKKKGVQMVRSRFKEMLAPLGFVPHPRSRGRLVRVRDEFIDEVSLDAAGYHLQPVFSVFYRPAPFCGLRCDEGRLWRTEKENIATHLSWHCEIPPEGGSYYYRPEHFEEVWRDAAFVLEHSVLPGMEEMTAQKFLSLLVRHSPHEYDLFQSHELVRFDAPYFVCMPQAAVYGVGMWREGHYDEGVPYLTYAQEKFRLWLEENGEETNHFYRHRALILSLLDDLTALWKKREENWTAAAQERIRRAAADWAEYMP